MSYYSIAIDGPVAAGKTTQAKELAKRLGFVYVDTGAMYRAFAVHKLWLEKETGFKVSVETALNTFDFDIVQKEDGQHILVWDEDVTPYLRTPEVSMVASQTSAHPAVREAMMKVQLTMPTKNHVVMEGRDIGTVIIPNATLKVFLTAKAEVRARRRWEEQCLRGITITDSYEKTLLLLKERDRADSNRTIAPLKQADDAVLVDCTEMSIEETTDKILAFWNAKMPDWRRFD